MKQKLCKDTKAKYILILVATLFLIFISSSSMSSAQESTMTTKETLEGPLEIAKALNPNDTLLLWIDINATVDPLGDYYLPVDPSLYGIEPVAITFAVRVLCLFRLRF